VGERVDFTSLPRVMKDPCPITRSKQKFS